MTEFTINLDKAFFVKARGVAIEVDIAELPAASLTKIFEYGMQRIVNDACAGAKDDEQAKALAEKKLDNLFAGIIRASGTREGNPVAAEAMKIAMGKVRGAAVFRAWVQENGLKLSDKEALAKQKELAQGLAKRDDIVTLARANVESVKDLDIDLDI